MKRLLEGDATEAEQSLLQALRFERPSPELEQRMRAAIGLLPIAASVAPPPPVTPAAPAAKTLGTWGALAAGSVIVAAFVGGGAWLGSDEASVDAQPPEPPARIVVPSEPAEPAPTPAIAPETKAPDPAVESAPVKPRTQPSHPVSSASLREEIRLIDSARVAVKAKEGARAVQILDGYARRFPSGTFREEARLLRVEALKQR